MTNCIGCMTAMSQCWCQAPNDAATPETYRAVYDTYKTEPSGKRRPVKVNIAWPAEHVAQTLEGER